MDPVRFSGNEILEMAVRIEENGLRFYTDAGKASKNAKLKDLFSYLASEEKNHIKCFEDMKRLMSKETASSIFDPYAEEAGLYMQAFADSEVFKRADEGARLAKTIKGEKEALEYAITMEKDSILFYYEFMRAIREKDRGVLDRLIQEERVHLMKLALLKNELFEK
ncbi:MAG: ferritin family protein [Deltaproteobacteria bacterium]|nr:ferritin family protein [Deltaproteobacteria bacterium]